ncbi:MAG: nicotinate (nicotinamide) nucleotide adenylyltransferase [Magnetococcales bacterium]|nr:nicotinate (nicotinamide) nucleotide adenylyltransferase [Magnetococcales bacterium]
MSLRLGILGGSFDPPHIGHLRLAIEVRENLSLDTLLLVPSGNHPLKSAATAAEHRLAMTTLAVQGVPGLAVSDREAVREGLSFTVETLQQLGRSHEGAELFFLMGSDLVSELHLWKSWQRLTELARLVILTRPGFPLEWSATPGGAFLQEHLGKGRVLLQPVTLLDIRSRQIRATLAKGASIRFLVPEAVEHYIHTHRLYRDANDQ